jgi:hypothetical protein
LNGDTPNSGGDPDNRLGTSAQKVSTAATSAAMLLATSDPTKALASTIASARNPTRPGYRIPQYLGVCGVKYIIIIQK